MGLISIKHIFKQLKADLIGKDSYRGVTLTYSWLANQLGHFTLGFIPTLLVCKLLGKWPSISKPEFWAALIIFSIWVLFELYNFLGPLLLDRTSNSSRVYTPGKRYVFNPAWGNVAFDTFTDVCFFGLGSFSAALYLEHTELVGYILLGLLLATIFPVKYWFPTKMYLQIAQYPYQFRLSQWKGTISEDDKNAVNQFLEDPGSGKHLLVFGKKGSGKTSLSIGIATELSFKHTSCTYLTAMKLYSLFFDAAAESSEIWTWRTADLLVIDDINPGDPIMDDLVNSKKFQEFMDTLQVQNEDNRGCISSKNVIWVLGNKGKDNAILKEWEDMLGGIGADPQKIKAIELLPV